MGRMKYRVGGPGERAIFVSVPAVARSYRPVCATAGAPARRPVAANTV